MPLTPEQITLYTDLLKDYREGKTIPELAMRFGGDLALAERTLRKATKALLTDTAEEVRVQELDRLATLEAKLWGPALHSAGHAKSAAFDRLLRVIALRLEWAGCRPAPPPPAQLTDRRLQIVIQTYAQEGPTPARLLEDERTQGEQGEERGSSRSPATARLDLSEPETIIHGDGDKVIDS